MTFAPDDVRQMPSAFDELDEWQQFTPGCRANILIVGDLAASQREGIAQTIQVRYGLNVFRAQDASGLVLPATSDVLLVLDDACRLTGYEQDQLLRWIGQYDAQITSFAPRSLYEMVCEGHFVDRLYYYLNTICVVLTATSQAAILAASDR